MNVTTEEAFRRLTIGGPEFLERAVAGPVPGPAWSCLDPRTRSLMRIAALIAVDAPPSSYRLPVSEAQLAGATLDDLLGVLLAVAETVGSARVIAAAPRLATAAGYDVEAALG